MVFINFWILKSKHMTVSSAKFMEKAFRGAQLNKMLSLSFLFGCVMVLAISGFLLEKFINLFK